MAKQAGSVFVTVGTTLFDSLIQAVDSPELQDALRKKGYDSLIIQIGRGRHIPAQKDGIAPGELRVESFPFQPSLAPCIQAASLVISHAGSGSIFETLRAGKPLVVVVNEALMDNHQRELADALAERGHLYCATPKNLTSVIDNADLSKLVPYPPPEADEFARALDSFLGFPEP